MIDARQRRAGVLAAGCFFMEIMDGTIVSTAAPRLSEAMRVPVSSIGLLITAYFVTLAVLIPSSGSLVSRLGTRRVFLSAIVVFTVASLLCSTRTSLGELTAFRVLRGAGAAMMTPVGRLSVLARTAKSDRARRRDRRTPATGPAKARAAAVSRCQRHASGVCAFCQRRIAS